MWLRRQLAWRRTHFIHLTITHHLGFHKHTHHSYSPLNLFTHPLVSSEDISHILHRSKSNCVRQRGKDDGASICRGRTEPIVLSVFVPFMLYH